jgi:hypothetical protein
MTARAALGAESDRAEGKVNVVHDNKQVVERRLVPVDRFPDR